MASSKEYLEFVIDQLSGLHGITHRAMMGEFVIYYRGIVVGGVYDDRFLVKDTESAKRLMPGASLEIPYEGGRGMLLADVDDRELLCELIPAIAEDLTKGKKAKK